jgi:hypothetical protein
MNYVGCIIVVAATAAPLAPPGADGADEARFYDRLHQTFLHLTGVAIDAYLEHFADEPHKLAVVHYYGGRLAQIENDRARAGEHFRRSFLLAEADSYYAFYASVHLKESEYGAALRSPAESQSVAATYARLYDQFWGAGSQSWMRAAMAYTHRTDITDAADYARLFINNVGFHPHVVLQRGVPVPAADLRPEQWVLAEGVARCPLYDPHFIWVHRQLADRAASTPLDDRETNRERAVAAGLVRRLRELPENRDLSLRKFLDQNRADVWRLGWLNRSLGVKQAQVGDHSAARTSFLQAATIGDALFPPAERGRMDRFDRVFLAELGDVYARLGRYDLMLRYMYSDQGLPAINDLARPIAELARVAESVRLARRDTAAAELNDEALPQTVNDILFGEPLPSDPAPVEVAAALDGGSTNRFGWLLVGGGGLVLLGSIAWVVRVAWQRPSRPVSADSAPLRELPLREESHAETQRARREIVE